MLSLYLSSLFFLLVIIGSRIVSFLIFHRNATQSLFQSWLHIRKLTSEYKFGIAYVDYVLREDKFWYNSGTCANWRKREKSGTGERRESGGSCLFWIFLPRVVKTHRHIGRARQGVSRHGVGEGGYPMYVKNMSTIFSR